MGLIAAALQLCLRLASWTLEQRPTLYRDVPAGWLNFLRFTRTHVVFSSFETYTDGKYRGRTMATVFGSICPFWDVCFGTSPFQIRYSVPIPFVDFTTHSSEVFCTPQNPQEITWSTSQWVWHAGWILAVVSLTFYQ